MQTPRSRHRPLMVLLASVAACAPESSLDSTRDALCALSGGDISTMSLCPCDPWTDPTCQPPPPPPPAAPAALTFSPFSEQASVRLAWTSRSNATWYEVQRLDGGAWTSVYSGGATTVKVPIPWNGEFRFHVRACNDSGCSAFQDGLPTRVSLGPVRPSNGSQAMAFSPQSAPATPDYSDGSASDYEVLPVIGWGFDILRQDLTQNTCVDMTNAQILDMQGLGKDYHIDVAHTRSELATELGFNSNLGINAKFGNFNGGYTRKKELVSKTKRVEDTTAIVAHLRYELTQRNLSDPALRALLPDRVSQIQSGNATAFRRECGDALVSSIAMGREVDIVIQLTNLDYSSDVLRTQTNALNAELNTYKINYDSTTRQHIVDTYTKYSMVANVVSVGSTSVISGSTSDIGQVLTYIAAVEGEPATNSTAIGYKTSAYSVPSGLSGYPDYRPTFYTLNRWAAFDAGLAERCAFFDHDLVGTQMATQFAANALRPWPGSPNLDTACFQMRRAVSDNVQNCQDTDKWSQCIAPDSPSCMVPNNGQSCVTVASQIPFWSAINQSVHLYGFLDTGYTKQSSYVSGSTCFGAPGAMLDLRLGKTDCGTDSWCPAVRPGVVVTTYGQRRASNGSNNWDASTSCFSAGVTITRPHYWEGTALIDQMQTAFALVPSSPPYQF